MEVTENIKKIEIPFFKDAFTLTGIEMLLTWPFFFLMILSGGLYFEYGCDVPHFLYGAILLTVPPLVVYIRVANRDDRARILFFFYFLIDIICCFILFFNSTLYQDIKVKIDSDVDKYRREHNISTEPARTKKTTCYNSAGKYWNGNEKVNNYDYTGFGFYIIQVEKKQYTPKRKGINVPCYSLNNHKTNEVINANIVEANSFGYGNFIVNRNNQEKRKINKAGHKYLFNSPVDEFSELLGVHKNHVLV